MTTETNGSPSPSGGGLPPCTKCGENDRAPRGSWCRSCRNQYAVEYRDRNRPRERFEPDTPCAREGCKETFTWRSTHKGQKYCSRRCYILVRQETKRGEKRWLSEDAKATRRRAEFRRRGYGITPEDFDATVVAQGSKCLICGREAKLVPDHCHDRSVFRGAICSPCNLGLGNFANDPAALRAAADYLERALIVDGTV